MTQAREEAQIQEGISCESFHSATKRPNITGTVLIPAPRQAAAPWRQCLAPTAITSGNRRAGKPDRPMRSCGALSALGGSVPARLAKQEKRNLPQPWPAAL